MLENKQRGIFALLDEECRKPNPQTKCFMQNVLLQYESRSHFFKSHINDFVIRHFGQNVCYTPVNFTTHISQFQSLHSVTKNLTCFTHINSFHYSFLGEFY